MKDVSSTCNRPEVPLSQRRPAEGVNEKLVKDGMASPRGATSDPPRRSHKGAGDPDSGTLLRGSRQLSEIRPCLGNAGGGARSRRAHGNPPVSNPVDGIEPAFREIVESVDDVLWSLAPDLKTVIYVNPACEGVWGYPPASLLAKPGLWMKAVLPGDRARVLAVLAEVAKGGPGAGFEYRLRRPDGSERIIDDRRWAITDAAGRVVRIVGVSVDGTERKRAEQMTKMLAAIVKASGDSIASLDAEGVITSWNNGAETLFGYTAAEAIGKHVSMLAPEGMPDVVAQQREIMVRVRRGETVAQYETVRRHKSGRLIDVSMTIAPRWDEMGRIVGTSGVSRDITSRKRLENDRLDMIDREQRRIGRELHDGLGQQLTAIEFMCQSLGEELPGKYGALRKRVEKITAHLRDALAHTRALSHGLVPMRMNGEDLITALEELARRTDALGRSRCRFGCSKSLKIEDSQAAAQLFRIAQEAVHNSLRHGRPDHIEIDLTHTKGCVRLRVTDDGTGFDSAGQKSNGIGLQIMQQRAQMVGAVLAVASTPGKGVAVECLWAPPEL